MTLPSGLDKLHQNAASPIYASGDTTLDELLGGKGFQNDLVYLLIGDRRVVSKILLTTAVHTFTQFKTQDGKCRGSYQEKVAFVDGNNHFNPYQVSKLAVSLNLSPHSVLENILIARAFTFDQMIELLEHRISALKEVKILLISGITTLWPNYEKNTFEELLKAIDGIKQVMKTYQSLIVITAPLHQYSAIKPVGGHSLTHFGQVLVLIENDERLVTYTLLQHPFLPETSLKRWLPLKPKRNLKVPQKNTTIDNWF